uniref:Uncharacterized protein n=1 Tax=Arundo donax TaxID=35708 RepID=A0A0A9BKF1_ARUDO
MSDMIVEVGLITVVRCPFSFFSICLTSES